MAKPPYLITARKTCACRRSCCARRFASVVQENKPAVVRELLQQFAPSHGSETPIYSPEGQWSYQRFEQWLVHAGVSAWPRLDSGQLDTDSDAFRMMYHVPGIEGLHALRDSLGFIVKAR